MSATPSRLDRWRRRVTAGRHAGGHDHHLAIVLLLTKCSRHATVAAALRSALLPPASATDPRSGRDRRRYQSRVATNTFVGQVQEKAQYQCKGKVSPTSSLASKMGLPASALNRRGGQRGRSGDGFGRGEDDGPERLLDPEALPGVVDGAIQLGGEHGLAAVLPARAPRSIIQ